LKKRLILLTATSSGLEYYDFVIYALASRYISQTFFPSHTPWLNLLNTLLIFATGYLVRPLGGLIFGSLGDRFGRKKSFTSAVLLMSAATFGIALLPGYQQWGVMSSVMLALLRIAQGISQGAELPGALTFMYEHANTTKRGFETSLITSGVGVGSMLGLLVYFILHSQFSEAQMQSFAWRIAFVLGGAVALFSYLLRRYTLETPLFKAQSISPTHQPIKLLFTQYWRQIFIGFGITVFAGSFIIYFLFLPNYLHQYYGFDRKLVYLLSTIGMAWSALLLPVFGYLSDRVGSHWQMRMSTGLLALLLPALFYLLSWQTTGALVLFVFIYQTSIAAMASCYPFLLARLFPTEVRYTGVAITYNTAFAVAGFAPLIIAFMIRGFHSAVAVPWFLSALALVSFFAACAVGKPNPASP
jgi:MFS transporter, MHS family, proline/betaine transporter